MRARKAVVVAVALVALLSCGIAALVAFPRRVPAPDPVAGGGFPLDDPRWASSGYSELRFGSYADLQEGDFAYGTVLPALSERAGHPVSGMVALADVTAQGTYQVFVMLTDPTQCADGCRTLSYRWNGHEWRLVADARAVSVLAAPDSFVYVTRNGGARTWNWDRATRRFAPGFPRPTTATAAPTRPTR